jgi:hypothetical protein
MPQCSTRLCTIRVGRCWRLWQSPSLPSCWHSFVGTDFMPKLDKGAFLIQTVLPRRRLSPKWIVSITKWRTFFESFPFRAPSRSPGQNGGSY